MKWTTNSPKFEEHTTAKFDIIINLQACAHCASWIVLFHLLHCDLWFTNGGQIGIKDNQPVMFYLRELQKRAANNNSIHLHLQFVRITCSLFRLIFANGLAKQASFRAYTLICTWFIDEKKTDDRKEKKWTNSFPNDSNVLANKAKDNTEKKRQERHTNEFLSFLLQTVVSYIHSSHAGANSSKRDKH